MTILVAMHLGLHTILISDRLSFKRDGQVGRRDYKKLNQSENHTSMAAGCSYVAFEASQFLNGKTITGEPELRGMSQHLMDTAFKYVGKNLYGDISVLFVSATIDDKAKLFRVVHDEFANGGRLKELTDHQSGEILFAIPRVLTIEQGDDFKREATGLFEEFMAEIGKGPQSSDLVNVTRLARSVGAALNRLAHKNEFISKDYDVGILSSTGLTYTGMIDFDSPRVVTLVQKRGREVKNDVAEFGI